MNRLLFTVRIRGGAPFLMSILASTVVLAEVSWFSSFPLGECGDSALEQTTTFSFYILYRSSIINLVKPTGNFTYQKV